MSFETTEIMLKQMQRKGATLDTILHFCNKAYSEAKAANRQISSKDGFHIEDSSFMFSNLSSLLMTLLDAYYVHQEMLFSVTQRKASQLKEQIHAAEETDKELEDLKNILKLYQDHSEEFNKKRELYNSLKQKIQELEKQHAECSNEMITQQQQKKSELTETVALKEKELQKIRTETSSLEEKRRQITQDVDRLQSELASMEEAERQRQQLEQQVNLLRKRAGEKAETEKSLAKEEEELLQQLKEIDHKIQSRSTNLDHFKNIIKSYDAEKLSKEDIVNNKRVKELAKPDNVEIQDFKDVTGVITKEMEKADGILSRIKKWVAAIVLSAEDRTKGE